MTNQKPSTNPRQNTPETDADWFELIRPEIDTSRISATSDDVIAAAKRHAKQVVDRTEMDIDLNRITWQASWELKAKHGYARGNEVKLSMFSLETNGWQRLMQTVRHELIHVWQHQHHEYASGSTEWARAHGSTFERWMSVLNVSKSGGKCCGNWKIECPSCGKNITKIKKERKEQIARFVHDPSSPTCEDCEHDPDEYVIKLEGEQVDIESLPEVAVPSDEQAHVFLYNKGGERSCLGDLEWDPETRLLRELPGVGSATTVALGDDVQIVDDLVDENGTGLSSTVREHVSAQYHDDLRDTVVEWYDTAVSSRSGADLELFQQVKTEFQRDYWQPIECIDGVGPLEEMCQVLRNVEQGDRLELTLDEGGTCTGQVIKQGPADAGVLRLSVESGPTIVRDNVVIKVPEPPYADHPVLKDEAQSHRFQNAGSYNINERKQIVEARQVPS